MLQHQALDFKLRTSLQCTLGSRAEMEEFTQLLALLEREGFAGIELNLPELDIIAPLELNALLAQYHLKLDMLATGAFARQRGLSLSNADEADRENAVKGCMQNIDYAAAAGCGVIIGFFKGIPQDGEGARTRFVRSLGEIAPYAEMLGVQVLLEATNRQESPVAVTMQETLEILEEAGCPNMGLLCDTYHISLEEPPVTEALCKYAGRFNRLHISDDNRAFPGLGSIDFAAVYEQLYKSGYCGSVAIEGKIQKSLMEDTAASAAYLRRL